MAAISTPNALAGLTSASPFSPSASSVSASNTSPTSTPIPTSSPNTSQPTSSPTSISTPSEQSPSSSASSPSAPPTSVAEPPSSLPPAIVTQTSTSTITPPSSSTPTPPRTSSPSSTRSPTSSRTTSTTSTSSNPVSSLPQNNGGGLSKAGTIAVSVVVPIAAIAILVVLAFFFWRRRKNQKAMVAARKEEVDDYGFNPNAPDTAGGNAAAAGAATSSGLPGTNAAGSSSEMRQNYRQDDIDGYRGWGPTSNKRTSRLALGTAGVTGAAAASGSTGPGHQRTPSGGAYEQYSNQGAGDGYYYPHEKSGGVPLPNVQSQDGPSKQYAYEGVERDRPSNDRTLGNVATDTLTVPDLARNNSDASSRYSTASTDDNAGAHQSSPPLASSQHYDSGAAAPVGPGRPGRSTMGRGYDDDNNGGRYDAVNF